MEAQKDCLVRAISKDGFVNAVAVYTRGLTERARQIHHTSPVATAALGRALAACSMMGNALKDNGASVTMQIKGDGPLGTILTVSDSEGNVRGYVQNPAVDLALREDGKLDVGTAVGHSGTLTVIKDLNMREPYVGTVDLLGGEIAEDVAAYYVESEQVPSACGLGVLIDRDRSVLTAGGYLIQLLPGAGEDVITKVEGGIYAAPSVTNLLKENSDPAVLLKRCCLILTWRSSPSIRSNTAATARASARSARCCRWGQRNLKRSWTSRALLNSPASSVTGCRTLPKRI